MQAGDEARKASQSISGDRAVCHADETGAVHGHGRNLHRIFGHKVGGMPGLA